MPSASKLPDAPGYHLCLCWAFGLGFEAQTEKPHSFDFVVKSINPTHESPGLTTPNFEYAKSFTSGARTVYSILPRSLTWPPPHTG